MSVLKISDDLVVYKVKGHNNGTDMASLGKIMQLAPEVFMPQIDRLFTSEHFYSGNSFSVLLSKFGSPMEVDKAVLEYDLQNDTVEPLVVTESSVDPATTPKVGEGGIPFLIYLNEDRLLPGDVIGVTPGNKVRVQKKGFRQGNSWVYEVVMENPFGYIPAEWLQAGQRWGTYYASYEEGAEQDGHVTSAGVTRLKAFLGRYRQQDKITGSAATEKLAVGLRNPKTGKLETFYIPYMEAKFWMQWQRKKNKALLYSRPTNATGSTGRQVASAAGLDWYIDNYGHTFKTAKLTARLLEEFTGDIWFGRVAPGSSRTLYVLTGEQGLKNIHNALLDNVQRTGAILNADNLMLEKVSSELNSNAYSLGFQITSFKMLNGGTLNVVHNPEADDPNLHTDINPYTGKPYESETLRFLALDGGDSGANIRPLVKRNESKFVYVEGLHGPDGPGNGRMAAHSGDYYSMHVSEMFGLLVQDPTRLGAIKFH